MRKELIALSLVAVVLVLAASGYLFFWQARSGTGTTSRGPSSNFESSSSTSSSSGSTSSSGASSFTTPIQTKESTTTTSIASFSSTSDTQTYTATATTTTSAAQTTSSSSYTYTSQTSSGNQTYYHPPGLPDCGSNIQFFTTSPINSTELVGIVPLGNLNPPQHVLPTDHLYFALRMLNQSSSGWLAERAPVVAPGNLTIFQISSNNYSPTHTDYLIYFWPCNQFYAYFDHITSLSPDLQALFVPPFDYCQQYAGGSGGQSCTKFVNVPVQAGQYIGTAGGVKNGSCCLDFGAVDYRVAPLAYAVPSHYDNSHLRKVCVIDYYTPTMAATLRSKLGSGDGSTKRTTPPLCGSINQDVVGTAQGNWFTRGVVFPVRDESQAIALVHDNVNASRGVFSIGSSMGSIGLSPGAYYFDPRSSGLVNLDFQYVKPDGNVYCYETGQRFTFGNSPVTVIMIQLLNASTMRIEALPNRSCGTGPWIFTANYADFQR